MPRKPEKAFVGVDPGASGGIGVLHNRLVQAYIVPESDTDLFYILEDLRDAAKGNLVACLEQVSSSPQMGVTSAFSFGKSYGRITYALIAAKIPFTLVRPQIWQRNLGIKPRDKKETQSQFKHRLRMFAQRLFPNFFLWKKPKSLTHQLAICDSLLLAENCRRNFTIAKR